MKATMNKITQFEDLSNDLFLDIFDCLHALDLFVAFSSLNKRISSVLCSTQLHVVVSKLHCRRQIKFLSSHLTDHAHQVISISLQDQLRDFSSVIPFFFNQHTFFNLRSCIFHSICSSSRLNRVIRQVNSLTKLELFQVLQPQCMSLSDRIKRKLSKTILNHKLSKLRSIELSFRYDYRYLTDNTTVNWTLTSLRIMFHGSSTTCSIYSILPILRIYRALRQLRVVISNLIKSNAHLTIAPVLPFIVEDNLPVSPSITLFDLDFTTKCDFDSLSVILRCMPNLRQFIITILTSPVIFLSCEQLLNGRYWQRLLTSLVPHIDVFDLFITMLIYPNTLLSDMATIVHSFDYFATKYDDWHVVINQSKHSFNYQTKLLDLHASRFSKKTRCMRGFDIGMVLGTFDMYSTATTEAQEHLFYYNITSLQIDVPLNPTIFNHLPVSPPYQNIDFLLIRTEPPRRSLWNVMMKLIRIDDKNEQRERADRIACLINLNRITRLEFHRSNDLSQLYFVEQVLLASPKVVQLRISTPLFLSPTIFDNPSLIFLFGQLHSLYLTTKHMYFSLKYASKLVQQFPSLVHIELRVFSLDASLPIVDILLGSLTNLIHIKIYFNKDTLLDDPCSIDYVIEKRRQAFPFQVWNKDEIFVKVDGQFLEIYLSGCSTCAMRKYYI